MKFFNFLMAMFLTSSLALAEDGGIMGSLQSEGQGAIGLIKILIIVIFLVLFFGSPAGGYFLGSKIAKKLLKNEQEEDAGWKVYAYGAGGAIAGIFVGYIAMGWFGSMLDPASGGAIDYAKGTNYLVSKIFNDVSTIASGG